MLVQRRTNILSSEITDERTYLNRRQFIQGTSGAALGVATGAFALSSATNQRAGSQETIPDIQTSAFSTNEEPNSFSDITSYNNFYEFGLDKGDPARHAHELTVKPWSVKVEGHVNKAAEYDLEDLLKGITFEERIYRLRCVEAWSPLSRPNS
jgi:sulfoxide reductase catalytic subunit YedY